MILHSRQGSRCIQSWSIEVWKHSLFRIRIEIQHQFLHIPLHTTPWRPLSWLPTSSVSTFTSTCTKPPLPQHHNKHTMSRPKKKTYPLWESNSRLSISDKNLGPCLPALSGWSTRRTLLVFARHLLWNVLDHCTKGAGRCLSCGLRKLYRSIEVKAQGQNGQSAIWCNEYACLVWFGAAKLGNRSLFISSFEIRIWRYMHVYISKCRSNVPVQTIISGNLACWLTNTTAPASCTTLKTLLALLPIQPSEHYTTFPNT